MNYIEVIKTLLISWPFVILLISIMIILVFHIEIKQVIKNIKTIKLRDGTEISLTKQTSENANNPISKNLSTKSSSDDPSILNTTNNPVVKLLIDHLQNEYGVIEENKRYNVLIQALALARLQAGHEFTYNRIYGSQIMLLKHLNLVEQCTIDNALAFFKPYEEEFPQIYVNYGFNGWLGFLINNSLVKKDDNILKISEYGRDFLSYLVNARLVENKLW
ncbi:MAG: hypothetical protein HQK91_02355 [Nitrospirae bacterium]|nr:hypothetical protein [Nitrospirota bacterium]